MTSSGVSISSSAKRENKSPNNHQSQHRLFAAKRIEVWTVSDISFILPESKKTCSQHIKFQDESSNKKLVNKFISALVEPTAANGRLPLNCPTTIISTALNISCRIPDSISGSEKEISLSMMVPLHISISYLFCFTFILPPSISKLIWASVEVLYITVRKQLVFFQCSYSARLPK